MVQIVRERLILSNTFNNQIKIARQRIKIKENTKCQRNNIIFPSLTMDFVSTHGTQTPAPSEENYVGKLAISSPPVYISHFRSFVDCGSYVSYRDSGQQCYGRLIATASPSGNVMVNEFLDFNTVCKNDAIQ